MQYLEEQIGVLIRLCALQARHKGAWPGSANDTFATCHWPYVRRCVFMGTQELFILGETDWERG